MVASGAADPARQGHPIDILGEGGFCGRPRLPDGRTGAAMSLSAVVSSDLANLPTMRPGALQILEPG